MVMSADLGYVLACAVIMSDSFVDIL